MGTGSDQGCATLRVLGIPSGSWHFPSLLPAAVFSNIFSPLQTDPEAALQADGALRLEAAW